MFHVKHEVACFFVLMFHVKHGACPLHNSPLPTIMKANENIGIGEMVREIWAKS